MIELGTQPQHGPKLRIDNLYTGQGCPDRSKFSGNVVHQPANVPSQSRRRTNDRHCDQGGEQGVFDRGGAGFVGGEVCNEVFHKHAPKLLSVGYLRGSKGPTRELYNGTMNNSTRKETYVLFFSIIVSYAMIRSLHVRFPGPIRRTHGRKTCGHVCVPGWRPDPFDYLDSVHQFHAIVKV